MAEADATLRDRQPWKAAHEKDYAWLGGVITRHYHGCYDTDVKVLMGGIIQAFAGKTVHDTEGLQARSCRRPSFRPWPPAPREHVSTNGRAPAIPRGQRFSTYIVSGGDRDFMRPVTSEI